MRNPAMMLVSLVVGLSCSVSASAQDKKKIPNEASEPVAKALSLDRSARWLDDVALEWTRKRNCGSCHTNYPYLFVRPLLPDAKSAAHNDIRKFFEGRATNWNTAEPLWDTEVVATAASLAIHDSQTTGKLHPATRTAFDRMWKLQRPDGAWNWLKCDWPPLEHDDYFGAVFAAVGVGHAPEGYANGENAREGVAKLLNYFAKNPAPNDHHAAWLLWASTKLEGLLSPEQKKKSIDQLLKLQKSDGGWSLPSLGDWKGKDNRPNNLKSPSDGYATGLVVFVLRQAGVDAKDASIQKGLGWLQANQRESGRWFTHSLNSDRNHYISHAGTAFALLAIRACEEPRPSGSGNASGR